MRRGGRRRRNRSGTSAAALDAHIDFVHHPAGPHVNLDGLRIRAHWLRDEADAVAAKP